MKPARPFLLTAIILTASLSGSLAASPAKGRTLPQLNVIPTDVLQRSISPKFYKTLLISPIEGWIIARANLSGTHLSGTKIVRSELQGLYDPLAFQLAKEAQIAGSFGLDRPNVPPPVLLHLLVYKIADGTLVLSFAHFDGAGGNQMSYYGCARLLVLKGDGKWTEIKGPDSLQGKGLAVRQGMKNSLELQKKMFMSIGAEGVSNGGNGQ